MYNPDMQKALWERADREQRAANIATWIATLAFLAGWVFCVVEFGFLLGFFLGWIPAGMIATVIWSAIFGFLNRKEYRRWSFQGRDNGFDRDRP